MGCISSKQAKCSPPPSPVSHYLIAALPPPPPLHHDDETSLVKRVGSAGFSELERIKEEPEKEEAEVVVVVVKGEEDVIGGGDNLKKQELINSNSNKENETEKKGASFVLRYGRYTQAEQIAAGWPPWLSAVAGEAIDGWLPLKADSFEKLDKVGQGTYSNVYRARDLGRNGKMVALKKVRFDTFQEESVRFMAREIVFLRRLDHPNVMKLEGVITNRLSCSVYLVFEYMEHDLSGLISSPDIKFTNSQIKCYMKQLMNGIEHCHERGIMHRDIKTSNILLNNDGILKIADFGLANYTSAKQRREPLTSRVVTLWYRPPELLLGSTNYTPSVDLWSIGCVFAELHTGKPILKGRTEVEQLHKIFKLCGSPQSDEFWKKSKLPLASMFKPQHPYSSTLRERCKELPKNAVQLLETLLSIEPHKRGTIPSIMDSEYFKSKPFPCEPSSLPKYPPNKEIDAKVREEESRRRIAGIRSRTLAAATSRNPTRVNHNHNNKALPQTSSISKMETVSGRRNINSGGGGGGRGKERSQTVSRESSSYDTVSEAASHTTDVSRVDSVKSAPIVTTANRKGSNSFSTRRGNNNFKNSGSDKRLR